MKKNKAFEIDMTSGPLLGKLLRFSIPLILSGMLQLLFNAADMVVIGRFEGDRALAAVGAAAPLTHLITNLFIGLSVGANVLTARYYGAKRWEDLEETVHTAIAVSLLCGAALIVVGVTLARPLLELMATPADVLDGAALYIRIYFCGMPVVMLYNFGSAVLRAVGDTQRPLLFLMVAGVINVVLNLFFVIILGIGVAGVAIATVLSQAVSAVLVLLCLVHTQSVYQVKLKRLRIAKDKLLQMAKVGIPAGIQGTAFSVSNTLIQSTVNSFGATAIAGNTAAINVQGFVFTAMDALAQTAQSFISQNYGAQKPERIKRVLVHCLLLVTAAGVILGWGEYFAGRQLLGIYTTDPATIDYGMTVMLVSGIPYFTFGLLSVMLGAMRGLGASVMPMAVAIAGVCGLRLAWIGIVFPLIPTWTVVQLSYPVSWAVTLAAAGICYGIIWRKQGFDSGKRGEKAHAC